MSWLRALAARQRFLRMENDHVILSRSLEQSEEAGEESRRARRDPSFHSG